MDYTCRIHSSLVSNGQLKILLDKLECLLETLPTSFNAFYFSQRIVTIFIRSYAAVTIYFSNQFCAAFIREQWLVESGVYLTQWKLSVNIHVQKRIGVSQHQQWIKMWWLNFGAKFPVSWSAVAFRQSGTYMYTAPPICLLVFFCQ